MKVKILKILFIWLFLASCSGTTRYTLADLHFEETFPYIDKHCGLCAEWNEKKIVRAQACTKLCTKPSPPPPTGESEALDVLGDLEI